MKVNLLNRLRIGTERRRSVDPAIFKAYDVRGIYPRELNEETAYLIGRAFVGFLGKPGSKIVVGRDGRLSSPSLCKNLIKGLRDQGANVYYISLSTTPMLYWAAAFYGFDGGINVTASHNPAQYNGFKFVKAGAVPISGKSGIKDIKKIILKDHFLSAKKGKIAIKNVLADYIKFNLKDFDLKEIKPFRIILDTANAVPGIIAPKIFQKLHSKIFHLYSKLDGSFPSHPPEPHLKENLKGLQLEVLRKKADLGIAFDGDGDRIIFVDERGKQIPGDFITALMIKLILKEHPGEKILCDVRSSNIVRDSALKFGGRVVFGRVGHSFIKEKMRKENIVFQGELNGHYYYREHFFCESPFFVILKILKEMSESRKKISELVAPFRKYFHSSEINLRVKDKKRVLKILEKKFAKKGKVLKIDGLRVDFKSWWFNIRPSHTDPVLRLVIEAGTKKLMEQKKKKLISLIK